MRRAQFRKTAPIDVNQEANLSTITGLLNAVDSGLPSAADLTYWATQSADKAIKSSIDAALALKADASYVSTELAKKIGTSALSTALAAKQDQAAFNTAIAAKLDKTTWDTRIGAEGAWFNAFKDAIILDSEVEGVEFDYESKGLLVSASGNGGASSTEYAFISQLFAAGPYTLGMAYTIQIYVSLQYMDEIFTLGSDYKIRLSLASAYSATNNQILYTGNPEGSPGANGNLAVNNLYQFSESPEDWPGNYTRIYLLVSKKIPGSVKIYAVNTTTNHAIPLSAAFTLP